VNPGVCEKWKLLAYHLEDFRVPQVGNPWPSGSASTDEKHRQPCPIKKGAT